MHAITLRDSLRLCKGNSVGLTSPGTIEVDYELSSMVPKGATHSFPAFADRLFRIWDGYGSCIRTEVRLLNVRSIETSSIVLTCILYHKDGSGNFR